MDKEQVKILKIAISQPKLEAFKGNPESEFETKIKHQRLLVPYHFSCLRKYLNDLLKLKCPLQTNKITSILNSLIKNCVRKPFQTNQNKIRIT